MFIGDKSTAKSGHVQMKKRADKFFNGSSRIISFFQGKLGLPTLAAINGMKATFTGNLHIYNTKTF